MKIRVILIVSVLLAIVPVTQKIFAKCNTSNVPAKKDVTGGTYSGNRCSDMVEEWQHGKCQPWKQSETHKCTTEYVEKTNKTTVMRIVEDAKKKKSCEASNITPSITLPQIKTIKIVEDSKCKGGGTGE